MRAFTLITCLFFLGACGSEPAVEEAAHPPITVTADAGQEGFAVPPGAPPTLLILGSSLSVPAGLPPEQHYAGLLQGRIPELRVLNASIARETAEGAAERLHLLLKHPLKGIVLETGQADEARGTSANALSRGLRRLLRQASARYPEIPVLLLPSTADKRLAGAIRAATQDFPNLSLSEVLLKNGAHPNANDEALHQRAAQEVLQWWREEGVKVAD